MAPKFIKEPTTSHGFTSLLCSGIAVRRMDKGTSNSRRPLRGSKADDEVACDHRRISSLLSLRIFRNYVCGRRLMMRSLV